MNTSVHDHRWSLGAAVLAALALVVSIATAALAAALPGDRPAEQSRGQARAAATVTIVAFAGDIADGAPGSEGFLDSEATAARVRAINPKYVLTGGDNAYPNGSAEDFATKYEPTWGEFKAITKPSPGNHEYYTPGASGYYGYFFGGEVRPYYAVSLGSGWRAYSLNCEIACGTGSAQLSWLQNDLATHPNRHYLVYLHRPRFTTGPHAPYTGLTPIWAAVQSAGGDLMLAGHNHHYERFAKLDANGQRSASGMVQMVAGAGGAELYAYPRSSQNSLVRNNGDYGVLRLTLRPHSYTWRYVGTGRCWDGSSSYACPARNGAILDSGTRATNNP